MSTAFSTGRSEGSGVFSRTATGPVREVSLFDDDDVFVSRALHPSAGWLLSRAEIAA